MSQTNLKLFCKPFCQLSLSVLLFVAITIGAVAEAEVVCPPVLLADAVEPSDVISTSETFIVPDGTPEELLQLIRQKSGGGIAVQVKKEEIAPYVTLFREIKAIADQGLTRQPTDAVRKELLQSKSWAYSAIADYESDILPEYEAFVREVDGNPNDREAAIHIRGRYLGSLGDRFRKNGLNETEFRDFRKLVLEFLNNKAAEPFLQMLGLDIVSLSLKVVDQTKERTLALETAAAVKKLFENSEQNQRWAYRAEAILNEHWASKDGLKVKGIQPDGKEFDLDSLKGKVVLLILWSNRQVPFKRGRTELEIILPHIKELYEKYHSKGFEIVDICIDTRVRGPLEGFIGVMSPSAHAEAQKQQEAAERQKEINWEEKIRTLPWSIHLSLPKSIEAGLPSVMEQYDLFGDHQFLLAPDGKVIVSKMGSSYNEEIVKKRVSGLTWEPGKMPQPWEDRFSTLEFEDVLETLFP